MSTLQTIGRVLASLAIVLATDLVRAADAPPVTPVRPVTTDYFGTAVVDPYRYLENLSDPEVMSWMRAEANYTRARLDAIPGRAALLGELHALDASNPTRFSFTRCGQRYFYMALDTGATLPKLYYRDGLSGTEHVLVDPAELGRGTDTHYALDYYTPSLDGRLIAYGISQGGSEKDVLHVMQVDDGKMLGEAIDRTSEIPIAWRPDNRSFFYMRYNKPGPDTPDAELEYNGRTYLHKIGANASGDGDAVVFGRGVSPHLDVPEGQGTWVTLSADSNYAIAVANHNVDANPSTVYVAPLSAVTGDHTPWRKVADVKDGVTSVAIRGDKLLILSLKDAPRFRLLETSLAHPDIAHASVIVPEGDGVLAGFAVSKDGIYLQYSFGTGTRVSRVSFDGKSNHPIALPYEGSIDALTTDAEQSGVLLRLASWTHPPVVLAYDPQRDAIADTGIMPPSKLDTSDLESKDVMVTSSDGTRVPLTIIYKKGIQLDGSHPTLLEGYGSYGISLDPNFDPRLIAWFYRNGVYAVAHVRGGGELGEDWHKAGQLLTKPNTISDFIACAEYLVDQHYTVVKRLGGIGGSAGGITVGGALTRRPDLFGVILDEVGMSDTLRSELEPNGPPNMVEYGSTATEAGFHGLYAMGAYFHVRPGTAYPAVMFTTGANDPRVAPWHMLKMTARVQAATSSDRPVLLRVDYDAGHGIGSTVTQAEDKIADLWSFSLWQMGEPAFQPKAVQ